MFMTHWLLSRGKRSHEGHKQTQKRGKPRSFRHLGALRPSKGDASLQPPTWGAQNRLRGTKPRTSVVQHMRYGSVAFGSSCMRSPAMSPVPSLRVSWGATSPHPCDPSKLWEKRPCGELPAIAKQSRKLHKVVYFAARSHPREGPPVPSGGWHGTSEEGSRASHHRSFCATGGQQMTSAPHSWV